MDLYDEDLFVEWLTTQTNFSPDALAKIYQSYWLLDPLERDGYNDEQWRNWIRDVINQ